jgi:signal transduction histidine kinase
MAVACPSGHGPRVTTVHARRWLWLFWVCRIAAALVGAGLLALRPVGDHDLALGTIALAWAGTTVALTLVWPQVARAPAAWLVDAGVCLGLVGLSGDWRSPFYLFAVSAVVIPATALPFRAAIAAGGAFAIAYLATAIAVGIDWATVTSTARLETFSTHLLIPLLVAVSLGHAARALAELDDERARAQALALEGERRRIGWELHDSAKQRIHAAQLVLSAMELRGNGADAQRLAHAQAELTGAIADVDASLTELRTTLGGLALAEAIRRRAAELEAASGIPISVAGNDPTLPTFAAVHAYRVACEALSNAVRHAQATRIEVRLTADGPRLLLTIADDGRGWPTPNGASGTGLNSMQARARILGGRLRVDADARGAGTRVELEVPLDGRGGSTDPHVGAAE